MNPSAQSESPERGLYDPLDMNNYRIEKLPKRAKGKVEQWLAIVGIPLAIVSLDRKSVV